MINNILELNNILSNNTNYKLSNLTKDFSKFLLLELIENSQDSSIIVFPNDNEAQSFFDFIQSYSKTLKVNFFPSLPNPFSQISPAKSLMVKRIDTLANIYLNKNNKNIVVSSIAGLIQKTLAPNYLKDNFLALKKGDNLKIETLIDFLIAKSYKKVSMVISESEFAVRGDILDICIPQYGAVRVDFFDETIERIRLFDILSQKSFADINEISIKPAVEIILNEETIHNFKINYQRLFGKINKETFELLDKGILPKFIENYIPLFYEKTTNLLSYIGKANIFVFDGFVESLKESISLYTEEYNYLSDAKNIFTTSQDILPPSELIFSLEETTSQLNKNKMFYLSNLKKDEDNNLNFDVKTVYPLWSVYKNQEKSPLTALTNFIKDNSNKQFLIFIYEDSFAENIKTLLQDYLNRIVIINNPNITEGFIFEEKIIITQSEITGIKKTFSNNKKKSSNKILQQLSSIEIGDIVLHVKHGFGEYRGIHTLSVNGADHDFLEINYRNNEKLFVPVENIDTITRHSGQNDNIVLDKLGSSAFEKKSNKIKEKIKDIAYDLIQIAAQRNLKKAPAINFNQEEYNNFLQGFPFVETEDQLNAINDVFDDLQSGVPTDRLICGDVGFGKTEVILRAAFLVANSGYQVAVVAPTTLLCNQHYNNFKERFKNFAINIEQLSRFTPASKRKQHKENLANGKIDIIIGTHSLLAKDVKFKNLALIIVDEEQSFGVVHKEKLKTFKEEAHILTLSATPIPRTIQLAFKGIKELSIISTPPVDKLPIITYILPIDYLQIKKAILREKERGGQVFFVCPRISDISEIESALDRLNLDINYIVAHGQMPTDTLEQNMIDFKDKKYDVLISTNIIESGIDLHNVNTMIILKSDMMGLAQLYQLRGRVGRGNNQAYAYLLYDNHKNLSPKAEKRLQVLQNLDYLGASFSLASYDLDMRGAGNLLGEEQSGHIKEIGTELYQKLLEQEIKHIKSVQKNSNEIDIEYYNFSPNINLHIPVFIPKKYISDMETTMEIYQRIGRITEYSEIVEVKEEMLDRFGNLPYQVENLFLSIELKLAAKTALVEKINFGNKGIQLSFYQQNFPNVDALLNYIQSKKEVLSLKPEGSILIHVDNLEVNQQIKLVLTTLSDIKNLLH
ncbi:MAG: transcription-repair coupling factor [Alphaproteobacteria bacterium]|jgi:transcription-repair coupling factor (superfamily II helicase)|nr:transcription-repair coupling factor [Alphaproteobacteria bacterium]